jgi:hypothetical protein
MRKRLVAAIVVPAIIGGGAAVLTDGVADASTTVTVCKREVLGPNGWACVETTTCTIFENGAYICDDGTQDLKGGRVIRVKPVPA